MEENNLKIYMGHSMASGVVELIACLHAAKEGKVHGARNLIEFDPRYGDLGVCAKHRTFSGGYILTNSFGLGGVNASLLVKLI